MKKKRLVRLGNELCMLNQEDISFIMRVDTTEIQCQQRMTTARNRLALGRT